MAVFVSIRGKTERSVRTVHGPRDVEKRRRLSPGATHFGAFEGQQSGSPSESQLIALGYCTTSHQSDQCRRLGFMQRVGKISYFVRQCACFLICSNLSRYRQYFAPSLNACRSSRPVISHSPFEPPSLWFHARNRMNSIDPKFH